MYDILNNKNLLLIVFHIHYQNPIVRTLTVSVVSVYYFVNKLN